MDVEAVQARLQAGDLAGHRGGPWQAAPQRRSRASRSKLAPLPSWVKTTSPATPAVPVSTTTALRLSAATTSEARREAARLQERSALLHRKALELVDSEGADIAKVGRLEKGTNQRVSDDKFNIYRVPFHL